MTDFNNPASRLTKNFIVHEAIYLPGWRLMHMPSVTEQATILKFADKMQQVRDEIGKPFIVHCWLRPRVANLKHPANAINERTKRLDGDDYNAMVGGARESGHIYGNACDFHVDGMTIKDATQAILPLLEPLGLRMERHDGGWIHLDSKPVGTSGERWFKP